MGTLTLYKKEVVGQNVQYKEVCPTKGVVYVIALSGLIFELYTRGGHLNHEVKPSGFKARLECTNKPR